MAQLLEPQDSLPLENGSQMRRPFQNQTSDGTPHLQTKITEDLENS